MIARLHGRSARDDDHAGDEGDEQAVLDGRGALVTTKVSANASDHGKSPSGFNVPRVPGAHSKDVSGA